MKVNSIEPSLFKSTMQCRGRYRREFFFLLQLFLLFGFEKSAIAEVCFNDITQFNNPVCAANDVNTTLFNVISGPSLCVDGTLMLVRLQAETIATSSARQDIGYWLALDGGDAKTGTCFVDYLPPPLSATVSPGSTRDAPFYNEEAVSDPADTCGDIEQGVTNFRNIGATVTPGGVQGPPAFILVPCQDADNDGTADTSLCTTWNNNDADFSCTSALLALPSTPAKCRCGIKPLEDLIYMELCTDDTQCDDNNPCTVDSCDTLSGDCINTAIADGDPCNDGDLCTTNDICINSICAGSPLVCPGADECHEAGFCNPETGFCTIIAKPDDTQCGVKKTCLAGNCLSNECDTAADCPSIECLAVACVFGSCIYDPAAQERRVCGSFGRCHQGICAECDKSICPGCDPESACSEANLCNLTTCTRSRPIAR